MDSKNHRQKIGCTEMERLDIIARRAKRWKLSMKFLTSCCNVMVKSKRVTRWEDLNRDLLVNIFGKLNAMDIFMVASRVCVSWFLASHDRSLWRTIDLTCLEPPTIFFNRKAGIPFNLWVKDKGPFHQQYLRKFLTEITKLSCKVPTTLFFDLYSYIDEENLIIAAERMPNIEKLVFPIWGAIRENSFQFAFSQWKNLKTLIIIKPMKLVENYIDFQIIGENCTNLTNLKYCGDYYSASSIVRFLPNLTKLSLLCYRIRCKDVIELVTGLKNLKILNVSHCVFWNEICTLLPSQHFIGTVTQKVEKFIMCPRDCKMCMKYFCVVGMEELTMAIFLEKHWQRDEIEELEI